MRRSSIYFVLLRAVKGLLHRFDVQTSPQIPASDAAIGLPCFRDLFHMPRLGQFAFVVVLLNRHPHGEIARRQDVWPFQGEHQEHMRRPNAHALNSRQGV